MPSWKPRFKIGQRVAILSLKRVRGGAYTSTRSFATCVKFVRPTPFSGMECWQVKFDDGREEIVDIVYEAQEICKEELTTNEKT